MTLTGLVLLALALFLLTLYSILQANAEAFGIEGSRFVSIKLLDTASAASLFVTLVGALLLRHQFALGLIPRLNYKSTRTVRHSLENPSAPFETWRVEMRNTGLGSAIVLGAEYQLECAGGEGSLHDYKVDGFMKALEAIGLVHDRDYWIESITNGFSLSPKDDCFVFEMKMDHVAKMKRLSMVLYFQSQLGARYSREIGLIPRH